MDLLVAFLFFTGALLIGRLLPLDGAAAAGRRVAGGAPAGIATPSPAPARAWPPT